METAGMEEVLARLSGARVSEAGYDALYKNSGRAGSQRERRAWLLDQQRRQRNDKLDQSRGILELVQDVQMVMEWTSTKSGLRYRPQTYVPGFHRIIPSFKDTLMLSEWLVEKPEDLHDNWYMVPCPKGTRVLVVAYLGFTKCFTKYGQFLFEGRTVLPGGNPCGKVGSQCCVLDCVWYDKSNTLFVLDVLAWNNQTMTDCDTEFRDYWLRNQFQERPSLLTVSKRNHFIFSLLPKTLCTTDNLNEELMKYPMLSTMNPPLDGLLFYHKHAHYTAGSTPLVGWLYPYMVNEVLGAELLVNPMYINQKPDNYTTQADFIVKFEAKCAKKKHPRSRLNSTSSDASIADTDTDLVKSDTAKETTEYSKLEEASTDSRTSVDDSSMEAEPVVSVEKPLIKSAIFNTVPTSVV